MKLICFLLALITSYTVKAQTDTLYTTKGDTLVGKATIMSSHSSITQSIKLKVGKDKSMHKVYEIKSAIIDGDIYQTLKINNKYQLAKLVKSGTLSLYYYTSEDINSNVSFSELLLVKFNEQFPVPNLNFRKRVSDFLKDCPTVVDKLKAKEYSKGDLNKIIDNYNKCIDDRTKNRLSETNSTANNTKQLQRLNVLITNVSELEGIENKAEIIEMLTDLKSKVNSNSTIPNYLKGALKDSFKDTPELLELFNKIIED